jgi:type II secretory pathway pseudopilin PulG
VQELETNLKRLRRGRNRERGFSMVEVSIVVALIMIITATAIFQFQPILQDAKFDTAMRQVIDQLRQAREYSIANRRYVQVAFPVVPSAYGPQYEIVITDRNDLTKGGGAAAVLSTVPIQAPATFLSFGGADTPDNFGNSSAIDFGGINGGPPAGMLFQSDGELVTAGTYLPLNGTVFLGATGQVTSARAITVMGTTGRIRGWKNNGTTWIQF